MSKLKRKNKQISPGKVLKTGLIILLCVFIVHQFAAMIYKPITTASAMYYDTYDGIDITGYFVRDEHVIDYTPTGKERYVVNDGEKVAKGGIVAEVFSSSDTAASYVKCDELEKQIETLESINSVSDPASVDLDTMNNNINESYINLLNSFKNGNYLNVSGYTNDLLTLMNKKQLLTGQTTDFTNLLTNLKTQLSQLKAGLPAPVRNVTADTSGFFVSNVDGLEDVLKIDSVDKIDDSVFDKLSVAKSSGGFGKIVSNYSWYIVAKINNDEYLNFAEGSKVSLKTSINGAEEIEASVYKINASKNKNSAVVVFACNVMNGDIAVMRSAPMTIVTQKFSGIRISNRSVRVLNGQTGVYVVTGSVVKFKPIKILYSTDTFTLCEKDDNDTGNTIRLYDEVIERGKNLYDGKYIG